jgi:hypothetical protein
VIRTLVFIIAFSLCINAAWATDERSIKELRDALVALAPDVEEGEGFFRWAINSDQPIKVTEPERLLTLAQAAKRCGVDTSKIWAAHWSGQLDLS